MKRPDVFSSLYIMSACCLTANSNPRPEAMAAAEAIKNARAERRKRPAAGGSDRPRAWRQPRHGRRTRPTRRSTSISRSRAGKPRPDVAAKWAANAPLTMVDQYVRRVWPSYYSIGIEIGTMDPSAGVESAAARRR